MLSRVLSATANHFRKFEETGTTLSAEEVQDLVAILARATLDAAQLERQVVPREARLQEDELGDNVLPFSPPPPAA